MSRPAGKFITGWECSGSSELSQRPPESELQMISNSNRIALLMAGVVSVGFIIAIESNAGYVSNSFCYNVETGHGSYLKNIFERSIASSADGSTVYTFVHRGIVPGSRYLCSIHVVEDKVIKTEKSHKWGF